MKLLILLMALLPSITYAADVTFTWEDTNPVGTEFNLYCDGAKLNTTPIPDKAYSTVVSDGAEHTCHATAVAGGFESVPSNTITFTIPSPPTGMNITVNITLTFQ